jgi:polyisoprenoid-binding protein YceI
MNLPKKLINFLLSLSLTFLTHSSLSFAAPTTKWNLDTSHSSVTFTIDHLVISETAGKFTKFDVEVMSDKPDFSDMTFKSSVQIDSVNTDDAKRDEHLKGADFFDLAKYPTMEFVGTKFEKGKGKKAPYKVHGKLTIKGVTKDVVLDGKFNGTVKDPWGGTRAGFKVSGTIDRYDFGLKYNSVLEAGGLSIGQEVRITANIELIKDEPKKE